MATSIKTFNSEGGFGVNQTTIVDEDFNVLNVNSLEIKNSNFTDGNKKDYILSGLNSGVLTVDGLSTLILNSNTVNFITAHIIAGNPDGSGHYSLKIESHAICNSSGDVQVLSELTTTLKDSIPTGQSWSISSYDTGTANQFSYTTSRGGTTDTIKWIVYVQIVSVLWS
jgi:hypothetical protein